MSEIQTLKSVAPKQTPEHGVKHLAIIMDGNHRWAKEKHLPRAAGHRAGAKNVSAVAQFCADRDITTLTLFAFSTENWQRPSREVNLLMDLMRNMLRNDVDELNEKGVRLSVIGDRSRFAPDLQMDMNRAEALTGDNADLQLNIAANFGGRWDILQGAKRLALEVSAGRLSEEDVERMTEEDFSTFLSLGALDDEPDLCIRTGGDQRISNFLLWDFAYTEFYFTDTYWPDFNEQALGEALDTFCERQRRFGRRP